MPLGKESRAEGYGKARPEMLEKNVFRSLGKARKEVVVGPEVGLDNAVVSMGRGGVLVVTTDPVSVIPQVGASMSAWLSVHLIASDLTSSGVDPEFATFSYNFPRPMEARARTAYVREVGEECGRLGVAIVGGNTGSYPGGGFTVIGAGTMFGSAREGAYVTPAMARAGDSVLMTKHAAIEAAATLATSFPRFVEGRIGRRDAREAASMLRLCSTVEDARKARGAGLGSGGVSSMHDATEGGILGGLEEMARASGKAFVIDPLEIPVSREGEAVCRAFGIDPLRTMGEGALLVTCDPGRTGDLLEAVSAARIPIAEIGRVTVGRGLWLLKKGRKVRAPGLGRDPFWDAYEEAVDRGLR